MFGNFTCRFLGSWIKRFTTVPGGPRHAIHVPPYPVHIATGKRPASDRQATGKRPALSDT